MFDSFFIYAQRYVSGTLGEDATFRAYDLNDGCNDRRLREALRSAGFIRSGCDTSLALAECVATVNAWGLGLTAGEVRQCLCEWEIWRRLDAGEIRRWKKRT